MNIPLCTLSINCVTSILRPSRTCPNEQQESRTPAHEPSAPGPWSGPSGSRPDTRRTNINEQNIKCHEKLAHVTREICLCYLSFARVAPPSARDNFADHFHYILAKTRRISRRSPLPGNRTAKFALAHMHIAGPTGIARLPLQLHCYTQFIFIL